MKITHHIFQETTNKRKLKKKKFCLWTIIKELIELLRKR